MAETKNKIINEILFNDDPEDVRFRGNSWAFCVHTSVAENFKIAWDKFFNSSYQESLEYKLQIGKKLFDMNIIYVTRDFEEDLIVLRELIKNSQFSFPWEDNPTLFINVGSFYVLQQFVKKHNLINYILKTVEQSGLSTNDENIKVVTFSKSVKSKLNLIDEYNDHLKSVERYHHKQNYYMTFVPPWLLPQWQRHFKIEVNYKTYFVFSIFVKHLRTLNYTNDLFILDLLSIRLALCDDRNPFTTSNDIKNEIDVMIKRELDKTIKYNQINLEQFTIDSAYLSKDFLIDYLVYEFQDYFHKVKIRRQRKMVFSPSLGVDKPNSIIELAHESDIFSVLNNKHDDMFYIDGRRYDKMSFSLFWKLVETNNVTTICLDTDYKWLNDGCEPDPTKCINGGRIYLLLVGNNANNFVEDFVSCLKTIPFTFKTFTMHVYCNLDDYRIFDNLTVYRIDFREVNINSRMLENLNECNNLKTMLRFYNCTFENKCQNWVLLQNLSKLNLVEIQEDEDTWQYLFEYILDEIRKSNSKEFQFDRQTLVVMGNKRINFENFKFTIDEVTSKLEVRNLSNNDIIDLFDMKYELKPDLDKPDFDFYQ